MNKSTFIKTADSVTSIRADFIIALLPAIIWGAVRFGMHSVYVMAAALLGAALSHILFGFFTEGKFILPSLYTVFCGLSFGLMLYQNTSVLLAAAGGALSVFIVILLGGEGKCPVFAPIVARLIIFQLLPYRINKPERLPLEILFSGELPSDSTFDLVLGMTSGIIGGVSVIALLVGLLYLLIRKTADHKTVLSYIAVSVALSFIFPTFEGRGMESAIIELLSGEILFVSIFALSDYSSAAKSFIGKIACGAACAVLTFVLRKNGFVSESVFISVTTVQIVAFCAKLIYSKAKEIKYAN